MTNIQGPVENFNKPIESKKELKKMAKPLSELVVPVFFKVCSLYQTSEEIVISPTSEIMVGGRSEEYETGYRTKTILNVSSESINFKELEN